MRKALIILILVPLFGIAGTPRKNYSSGTLIHVFDPTIKDQRLGATIEAKDMEEEEDKTLEQLKKKQLALSQNEAVQPENNISNKTEIQYGTRGKVFEANSYGGGTPSDNTMALSNSGYFVSAINSNVEFYDSTGKTLTTKSLSAFANDASLTFTFDPKVIYDQEANKFILVFLAGKTPSTSFTIIAFSTSDDPRKKWNVYKLSGNPMKDNSWTDYPNIAVSKKDFYMTTNLFTSNNLFSQAIVTQIPKLDGYNGATNLRVLLWDNIVDPNSDQMLGLYPLQGGQSSLYGPGMYFASTRRGIGDYFCISHITGDYDATNNQMTIDMVNCSGYQVPRDAAMKGNSDLLSVGDCRVKGGFQLMDKLYFVFSGTTGTNIWSSIIYIKYSIKDKTFKSATLYKQFESYCYPNIASFATDQYDETVAICYNASASKYYPEARTIVCDTWMQFSPSDTYKTGDTYIEVLGAGADERWGDYSGITRWHSKPYRSVWVHNMVGQIQTNSSRTIGNYISELTSKLQSYQGIESDNIDKTTFQVFPNPVANQYMNIAFELTRAEKTYIQLFTSEGKEVITLAQQHLTPGSYNLKINTDGLSSGSYIMNIYFGETLKKTEKIIIP